MNPTIPSKLVLGLFLGLMSQVHGQVFDSGSTGAYGPLEINANTTLDLPADGIFHCTTINIAAGATLRFNRNPLNTPVHLLATGDVTLAGTLDVSGSPGTQSPPVGGQGGPGGFDGGSPAAGGLPSGAGLGPGAGKGGDAGFGATAAGSGAYGGPASGTRLNNGATYGSPLLVPIVGGSGGGGIVGNPGHPGSGGGGAIVVASTTRIVLPGSGRIHADGGESGAAPNGTGSGGAIRLVAPEVSGTGTLSMLGGVTYQLGGHGRARIDSLDRKSLQFQVKPTAALSLGSLMMVFPDPLPRLDITSAAGTAIAEGTAGPIQVQLPFGSSPERTVVVQARHFGASVPIRVVLTPENGTPVSYDASIDNLAVNPASATVNVVFPINTVVQVHAWTR